MSEFAAKDEQRIIFGAMTRGHGHDYEMLPRVPEADLLAFERETGLALPLEYRTYLENFGAGGAGPDYGIHDFRDARFRMDLARPFPRTEDVWGPDEECPEEDPVWRLPGLVYICDHGCGSASLIELNGPEPGRIWTEWSEGILKGGTLVSLYRDWIAKVTEQLDQYQRLKAVAEHQASLRDSRRLKLDEVVALMGCDYRTVEGTGNDARPDGTRKLFFGRHAAGHVLVGENDELIHVAIARCV